MSSTKSSCKTFEPKFIKQVQTAPLPYTLQTRPVKNKEPWLVNILSANYKKNIYSLYYNILPIIKNRMDEINILNI